jgi:hypothetical protein
MSLSFIQMQMDHQLSVYLKGFLNDANLLYDKYALLKQML